MENPALPGFLLAEGVGFGVDLKEALDVCRQVALGGGELGVAEEFLHGAEIGAVGEQVGGEAMAQGVRGEVGRKIKFLTGLLEDFLREAR